MKYLSAFALATLALLAACSEEPWQTRDIAGLMPPLTFILTDENGETVSAEKYTDKANLLFFGFTSCPDICPTTLARLSNLLEQLPPEQRDRIQVLFVSVDPGRDTPADLREYTDHFGPRFIGLTGTQEQLRALNKRYRVTYGYGQPDETGFYPVSHSSAVFGFAPGGEVRLLIRRDDSSEAIVSDLKRLAQDV